jgi:acetyl esterase/lipase
MTTLVSWLFLLVSVWGAWFTYNAYRPITMRRRLSVVSFFAGWLTTELALHHIAWQAICTAGFIWLGALHAWPGILGLIITVSSWAGLAGCLRTAGRTEQLVEAALVTGLGRDYRDQVRAGLAPPLAPVVDWRQILLPFAIGPRRVERIRDLTYARVAGLNLKLDVYRGDDRPTGCPVLMQIHGGAWVLGSKNEQGLPLMRHLAARGWVCVSVDYRLSPHATFPDHLIDLKRAIAWIRAHIGEYGGDPQRLVVTGGSAGGHLCSLVALTANDPAYQPGFEAVDTSTVACVSFYGIYDFTNRYGIWQHDGLARMLEKQIMKASLEERPDAYEAASPMSRIDAQAPPFMVVHGTHDTLAPVEEARRFCQLFRERARSPIVYAELPGAQHAFEIFPSLRTTFVLHGVERFLAWVLSQPAAAAGSVATTRAAGS